ncbi:G-protein coupled receptor 157-like isoform X2 [Dreissena polymorpha]|uniref:G-protein coupled receptor 157-like isoform X2 n=1 Tax=Dreissena polymorpha TaxID=45954 RepID=UPI0022654535|nr:G-protein coupled receptor 157-like isoform X2 [Dreissena polymorpha]
MDVLNKSALYDCLDFVPGYTFGLLFMSCFSSIVGCCVIFWTYLKLPVIRTFSRRLLLFLSAADFLNAAGNLIGGVRYMFLERTVSPCTNLNHSDAVCIAQSYITTSASMASFFWTSAIAIYILCQQLRVQTGISSAMGLIYYNLVCTGIPVIITSVAIGMDVLGANNSVGTGGWCWIRSSLSNRTQTVWMLLAGKFWEIACYLLTALVFVIAKYCKLNEKAHDDDAPRNSTNIDLSEIRPQNNKILYYCISLYLLRLWGTVRFFIAIFSGNMDSIEISLTQKVLLIMQSIGDSWQGFWNFFVFCLLDDVVRDYICACCRSCRSGSPRIEELEPILQD